MLRLLLNQFPSHSVTHALLIFRGPIPIDPDEVDRLLKATVERHGIKLGEPAESLLKLEERTLASHPGDQLRLQVEVAKIKIMQAISAATMKQLKSMKSHFQKFPWEEPLPSIGHDIWTEIRNRGQSKPHG